MFGERKRLTRPRFGFLAVLALLFVAIIVPATCYAADDGWFGFQHDRRHSGLSIFEGPQYPQVLWVVPFGGTGRPTTPLAITKDGKIYVGIEVLEDPTKEKESTTTATTAKKKNDGVGHSGVFAFSSTNKVIWTSKVTGLVTGPIAIGEDGTIYAVIGNALTALNERNGGAKWKIPLGGASTSGVTVADDGTLYVGTSDSKTLLAVSPEGKVKWRYVAPVPVDMPIAVGNDGTAYFSGSDVNLYAIGANGALKWSIKVATTARTKLNPPVLAKDDTIYVSNSINNGDYEKSDSKSVLKPVLHAYYPNGKQKWSYQALGKDMTTPAIRSDGTVVFGSSSINYSEDGSMMLGEAYVQAVKANGTEDWTARVQDNRVIGAPIIDGKFHAYVTTSEGYLVSLSKTGIARWRVKMGTNTALGPGGILYATGPSSVGAYSNRDLKKEAQDAAQLEDQAAAASSGNWLFLIPIAVAIAAFLIFKIRNDAKAKASATEEIKEDSSSEDK